MINFDGGFNVDMWFYVVFYGGFHGGFMGNDPFSAFGSRQFRKDGRCVGDQAVLWMAIQELAQRKIETNNGSDCLDRSDK